MSAEIFLDVSPAFSQTVCDRASERLDFLAGMSKTHTSGNVKAAGNKKKEKNNGDNQHALSLKAGKDYEF